MIKLCLPKELLKKDYNISFNKDEMITSFSSDIVEAVHDMKAYINNIIVDSNSANTISTSSSESNEKAFNFQN